MKKISAILILFVYCNLMIFSWPKKKATKKQPEIPDYEENFEFDEEAFEQSEDFTASENLDENTETVTVINATYESESAVKLDDEEPDTGELEIHVEIPAETEYDGKEESSEGGIANSEDEIADFEDEIANSEDDDFSESSEESATDVEQDDGKPEFEYVYEWESSASKNLIRQYNRKFEVGFNTEFGVSNNYFSVKEFLKKELVIDFDEMADEMPNDGLMLDVLLNSGFYANLNLNRGLHFGTSFGIESTGHFQIGKELFELMSDGFPLYEPIYVKGDATGDMFAYSDFEVGWNIGGFHIEAKPAFFHPLFHVKSNDLHVQYINPEDGSLNVAAIANFTVYGFTDLEPFFNLSMGDLNVGSDLCKGWGFDFAATVEHKIFDSLQAGVYIRTPIVPGTLNYCADVTMSASYYVEDFETIVNGESKEAEFDEGTKVYDTTTLYINRPFRFGTQLAWRPFGRWCTFDALLGLGVDHPFTSGTKAYAEYELGWNLSLFHILGMKISTSYRDQVFVHKGQLMLNLRIFELDLGVSAQGSDFSKSFKGSGVAAFVGFAFGF